MSANPRVDQKLRKLIAKYGSVKRVSEKCGISPDGIRVLLGNDKRQPTDATLRKLGYKVPESKIPEVVERWRKSGKKLNYSAIAAEANTTEYKVRWFVGAASRKPIDAHRSNRNPKYLPTPEEIWGKGGLAEQCREAHYALKREEGRGNREKEPKSTHKYARLVTP